MTIKRLFEAFLILLVTVALFLFFEGTLRVIYPDKITTVKHEPEKYAYVYNPHYLVSLKPNRQSDFQRSKANGGCVIHWETNSRSFRGPELREHSDLRIMVYGDSNVQAQFSSLENTFAYQLERGLRTITHRDIEVINAGLVGSGPDQYFIRFSEEVDVYHPSIVIFVVFADNDFGDLIRNRLFDLGPSGELVETGLKTAVDQELQRQPFQDFASNLLLVSGVRKVWRTVTGQHPTELDTLLSISDQEYSIYSAHQPRLFSNFTDHYDADLAFFPTSEAARTKVGLMNGVLRKAKQLADSKQVEFMVMIEPSSDDMTTNEEPNYTSFAAFPEYKRTNLSSFVERICVENHIAYINLWEPFSKNSPENLYFKGDDNHWNDAGQDLAAREAAKFIADRFLSKRAHHNEPSNPVKSTGRVISAF
jgi:hypothetical protein